MRDLTESLAHFEKVRGRTRKVVQAMPPEHWEYRFHPGRFTFAGLVRHLGAAERYLFVENVCGRQSCYPGHGPEIARNYDSPLAFLDAMHAESIALLAALTPEQYAGECTTVAGAQMPVMKLLDLMVEHEIHHRGQLYVYLGMLGIPAPPIFGLTEPEVHRRSRQS
jgi:uncharacterized damage-inducible protein DinB